MKENFELLPILEEIAKRSYHAGEIDLKVYDRLAQHTEICQFENYRNIGVLGWKISGAICLIYRPDRPVVSASFLISINARLIGKASNYAVSWCSEYDIVASKWMDWTAYVDEFEEYEPELDTNREIDQISFPWPQSQIVWTKVFSEFLGIPSLSSEDHAGKWLGKFRLNDFPIVETIIQVFPNRDETYRAFFSFEVENHSTRIGKHDGDRIEYEISRADGGDILFQYVGIGTLER